MILRWLKRQWDKLPESPGLIQRGNWFVIYNDGQRTYRMTYDVCCAYASIFGGKVYHITDEVAGI